MIISANDRDLTLDFYNDYNFQMTDSFIDVRRINSNNATIIVATFGCGTF